MRNPRLNVVVMLTVMAGLFARAGDVPNLAARTRSKYGIDLARILKVNKLTAAEFAALMPLVTPPVRKPIPSLLKLEIDRMLQANPLAGNGLLDVTGPPFGADNTGRRDSTAAIQRAINAARDNQMVCYFPLGTYLVSDTIMCEELYTMRLNGKILPGRRSPIILMGERRVPGKRPLFVLADNAKGFGNPERPKYVFHFLVRNFRDRKQPKPNSSFGHHWINLDLRIGRGNAGAVGVRFRAAEGSGIIGATIDATNGLTGVEGGVGSGGTHAQVTVIGGQYGLDLRQTQPVAVVVGPTLINQTKAAIICNSRGSLVVVGADIKTAHRDPVIVGDDRSSSFDGLLDLIDSRIEYETSSKAEALRLVRSHYLNNVYLKNAAVAVADSQGGTLPGRVDGWLRVAEYARAMQPAPWKGLEFSHTAYVDGKPHPRIIRECQEVKNPPEDLQSRHQWSRNFPAWDQPGVINVRAAPYLARGDGVTDDTAALQRAIDENEIVFLPRGMYRVTRTINLHAKTRLVGIGEAYSLIVIRQDEAWFSNPQEVKPVIATENSAKADTVMDLCGVYVPFGAKGAQAIQWRAGRRSMARYVKAWLMPAVGYGVSGWTPVGLNRGLIEIVGKGGGRWYNQYGEFSVQQKGYRHLLINGTSSALTIYGWHGQYALGEAQLEIRNASNVTVFGLKMEGSIPILWLRNSHDVRIFGTGGNAVPAAGNSLIRIDDCHDFILSTVVSHERLPGKKKVSRRVGQGRAPSAWHAVAETVDGERFRTAPLHRPVVYKRGHANTPFCFENALVIKNNHLRLAFDLASGRIVHLSRSGGRNLLYVNDADAVKLKRRAGAWVNYGGDKVWPGVQAVFRMSTIDGRGWPPDRNIDGMAWKLLEQGADFLRVRSPQGENLPVQVTRLIRLAPEKARVVIDNTVTCIGKTPFAAHVWSITQLPYPEKCLLHIARDRPDSRRQWFWMRCPSVVPETRIFNLAGGDAALEILPLKIRKFGKAGTLGRWIAAVYKDYTLAEFTRFNPDGYYAEGASMELFGGQDYIEIEPVSPASHLLPGESIRNQVIWELLPLGLGEHSTVKIAQMLQKLKFYR